LLLIILKREKKYSEKYLGVLLFLLLSQMKMKDEHLIVNDLDVRYREQGKGHVVLLLHGWGTNLATFNKFVAEWSGQNKRFISLDLPGFGDSELPPTPWDVSAYASFVRDFLTKLTIDQPHVIVGHSLGGRIAIKCVSKRSLKPEYLILIASAGMAKPHSFRNVLFMIIAKIGKVVTSVPPLSFFRASFRKKLYVATGSSDYLNAGRMKGTFLKVVQENLADDAGKISVPTLLIWGGQDTETSLTEARTLHDTIKGSQLDIIPQAGHFVHEEKPKEVVKTIGAFIAL